MTRRQLIPCALVASLAFAPLAHAQQPAQQPSAAPAPAKPAKKKTTAKPKAAPATSPSRRGRTGSGRFAPNLLGQYGDWGAYTAVAGGKKVCFALAKPSKSSTNPPERPRDQPYMFISSRPSEKVRNEVSWSSVMGSSRTPTQRRCRRRDVRDVHPERRRLGQERGRRGAAGRRHAQSTDAVVKGASARGTATTDTYSLQGLAQALDRVGQECR